MTAREDFDKNLNLPTKQSVKINSEKDIPDKSVPYGKLLLKNKVKQTDLDTGSPILPENVASDFLGGWITVSDTWAYSSADSPTFVITVPSGATIKYFPGMRIRLRQVTIKYFLITAVSDTTLTIYGGTDYTLTNATISDPSYSLQKTPFGFPASPSKWMVEVLDTSTRTQNAPTTGVWYNLGTTNCQISFPIGIWYVSYEVVTGTDRTSTTAQDMAVTLSTANNTESDKGFTSYYKVQASGNGANALNMNATLSRSKYLTITSKTLYYLNAQAINFNSDNLNFYGGTGTTTLRAISAYL